MDNNLDDLDKIIEESKKKYNIPDFAATGFIKGKWYKGSSSGDYYMKFDCLESRNGTAYNYLYHTEKIKFGTHSYINSYWTNSEFEKFMLEYGPVSKEELSKFLPKDHPDLQ